MAESETYYPKVDSNPNFSRIEENILKFWEKERAFNQSLGKNQENQEFVFYDGPPFANGLPHYGHLLTGFVKDIFPRYQAMKGKHVTRRFGWDCHGLPAEMGAEKELKISGRKAIEEYGIDKFNDYCRQSVMKYAHEWEDYVNRQARWVDFENDYKTMDKNYMESVMWAFSELYKKGLVYESHRVMPYSWAMETPVSNFETRMDNSYRERTDKAITVAFELEKRPEGAPEADKYYLLAWTTTPWTLPANLALGVSEEMEYVCVLGSPLGGSQARRNCYILAKSSLSQYEKELGEADNIVKGSSLIGLSYTPPFPYFKDTPNAFKVLKADFIEEGSGTGVVHLAPGFGEDDQRVCEENGIDIVCPVDEQGRYTDEIYDLYIENDKPGSPLGGEQMSQARSAQANRGGGDENTPHGSATSNKAELASPAPPQGGSLVLHGLNVIADTNKDPDEPYTDQQLQKYGLANLRIINWLKQQGSLIKQEDYKHNYPHCWRTDTPLIYRAMPSWYVKVTEFKDLMVELNQQINWIPEHIKEGRFGKWLEGARDWSISRNRYWGAPIPIWRTESGKIKVFGSIKELEEFFGVEVKDLHRPFIDTLTKEEDGETYRRVPDVLDCWFESGSMPFAQVHYPFENKDWFENHFPADFIVEYEAQTRGWFYTLMVLATALFDKPPFKNVICHGVVLDAKGEKLSKRLNNYPDPKEIFSKYGSDALRWMMCSSPIMHGNELHIDKEGKFIRDIVRLYIKPIWNAYNFFCLYANADGIKAEFDTVSDNLMDRYIMTKCRETVERIEQSLDNFDTPAAYSAIEQFFEVLNNWYIRRSKERFWKSEHDVDKQAAYNTLYTVLNIMCRAAAPLIPIITEEIWLGLHTHQ